MFDVINSQLFHLLQRKEGGKDKGSSFLNCHFYTISRYHMAALKLCNLTRRGGGKLPKVPSIGYEAPLVASEFWISHGTTSDTGNYSCAITSCGSFAELLNDADSAFDCNRPRVPRRVATPAYLRASLEISAWRCDTSGGKVGRRHVRKE